MPGNSSSLLIISDFPDGKSWMFPPIGPPGRVAICAKLLQWLGDKKGIKAPSIERADNRLVAELAQAPGFLNLNLQGGVILINGNIEAFTLGELLNKETAVVHIEKANPQISGLYAGINQEFCRHSWSQVQFINREQDLGVPGLRTAKMSYRPHHLVEKFRIRLG